MNFFQNYSTKSSNNCTKRFPANQIAKAAILFYQVSFSFFLGGNCRYYPSCSHYALESFEKHNFLKALYLVLKRLLSCHPFSSKTFYDPVPTNYTETRPI